MRSGRRLAAESLEHANYFANCLAGKDVLIRPSVRVKCLRLGAGDGEWCIAGDETPKNPVVYSFGVGRDISWDLAMVENFHARVFAFDPTPISREWLKDQELPSGFVFDPTGIGDYDGTATFSLPVTHGTSFSLNHKTDSKRKVECSVATFETLARRHGHTSIDILKMDIEGAEYDVLSSILTSHVRIDQILIEFHHRLMGTDGLSQTRRALELLKQAGYNLFYRSPRGLEFCFLRTTQG